MNTLEKIHDRALFRHFPNQALFRHFPNQLLVTSFNSHNLVSINPLHISKNNMLFLYSKQQKLINSKMYRYTELKHLVSSQ